MESNLENMKLLLEEQHDFPGPYTFKIVGPNTEEWQQRVISSASDVLGNIKDMVGTKTSGGAHYVSLTIDAVVQDAEQVLAVYDVLKKIEDVKMLI